MKDNGGSEGNSCSVVELDHNEARTFFLKEESYCTFDLPPYFRFSDLLTDIACILHNQLLSSFCCKNKKPRDFDDVNYQILNNKDGKYDWRRLELIHPALYVSLVNHITKSEHWELICKQFSCFENHNAKIKCLSLPVKSLTEQKNKAEQISRWWLDVEQKSIELSLDYQFLTHTDIVDCYAAVYTHSIPWALHGKEKAKKNRFDKNLIGNIIDTHIQDMRHGQTNGIPQGSVL